MSLTTSVAETIEQFSLIGHDTRVLVAVSGGADSIALLRCLHEMGYFVEAAHLNHQFRGQEAADDAEAVSCLCKSMSIHLTVGEIDVPALTIEQHVSAQQAARQARYDFLEQTRAARGLDVIATAHNLDDRIETVLLNMVRGCGVDGLRGIPYRRDKIIRPLLDTPRAAVDTYIAEQSLIPRVDSSNKLAKYARNNVRSELLPYLEQRYNPAVRACIVRLSEIAADESDYLNNIARQWIGGSTALSAAQLKAEPVALQRRILREWIRSNVSSELADVSQVLIEQLRTRLSQSCAITMPGGRFVAESNGIVLTLRELTHTDHVVVIGEVPLTVEEEAVFGHYLIKIVKLGTEIDEGSLHIRQWRDGDRITLKGGTKKVQDIFTDQKVPREIRRIYPLIADQHGLVSVGDIRYAARANGTAVSVIRAD